VQAESVTVSEHEVAGFRGTLRRLLVPHRRLEIEEPRRRRSMKEAVLVGPRGEVVCERCYVADRPLRRMQGLIGWRLAPSEGMLLRPTWSIHTAFVRFPIDAVFLDEQLTVLSIAHGIKPWRIASQRRAHSVLELPAGQCERLGLRTGDVFGWGWV
jgi:uncharacterized membrane protein (UPF0127 family)